MPSKRKQEEPLKTKRELQVEPHPLPGSWPVFEEDEIEAVVQVLRSGKVNYWTGGEGRAFEEEFARFIGVSHAVALANGTLALEAALQGIHLQAGDEVVVSPRTYVASASSIVMCGGKPIFADVDPDSQNITEKSIRRVLTAKTRAILVVHLAGWPCDMDPIMELAREHNLKVIEDCAQALGATYKGKPVGSLGHIGAFSFCQDKIMTTGGEGGMVTTSDPEIWDKIWSLKDHGKKYEAVFCGNHAPGFRWLVESFGSNWRMTEMQAAIGRVVLPKLPGWIARRRAHAQGFCRRLSGIPALRIPIVGEDFFHSYYKYYVFICPDRLGPEWTRDRILSLLNEWGIPVMVGGCSEVYLEKAFQNAGLMPETRLPTAKALGETSLMLPCHPTLGEKERESFGNALEKVMKMASGGL